MLAADPDASGVVSRVAERRRATGSDPVAAAVVALGLLGEPLLELRPQPVDVHCVQNLDQLRIDLERRSGVIQPRPDLGLDDLRLVGHALEMGGKAQVEVVELRLVADHDAARQRVEADQRGAVQPPRHGFHQGQPLLRRHLQPVLPQPVEERQEDPR